VSAASIPIPLILQRAENPPAGEGTAEIAELTRRLAAGEEEAFREFHERYFNRLYQFLLAVTSGDEPEAQEATQDALLRVARYARRFESEEIFWSWLKNVARSAARDCRRKRRRYLAMLHDFTLRWQQPAAGPDEEEERLRALLEETLGELPPGDRLLIRQKYAEGATMRELAARSGLTEKAVESRLLRLRRALREGILRKLRRP
jgi:RNA polymerase sigma-70 factor (ECF subfamily)